MINLEALSKELPRRLDKRASVLIDQSGPEAGKLVVKIEGRAFVASVCIWENGCCDFDFLTVATKDTLSWHYEFCCLEDAIRCVAQDINHLPLSARQAAGPVPS
jgi:hypothetical protein